MKVNLIATTVIVMLAAIIANGQSIDRANLSRDRNIDPEVEKKRAPGTGEAPRADESVIDFILSSIDDHTRAEFKKAWFAAGGGIKTIESVVLLYRGRNRSLIAYSEGCTNQRLSFSFQWSPTIIGIVHTHPNSASPEPQRNDLEIADKYRVPVFTITNRGMFVYDPVSKRTTKVLGGRAWLESPNEKSRSQTLAQN